MNVLWSSILMTAADFEVVVVYRALLSSGVKFTLNFLHFMANLTFNSNRAQMFLFDFEFYLLEWRVVKDRARKFLLCF